MGLSITQIITFSYVHQPLIQFSVPPQILPFDFGEESVNSGDLASVSCSVHKGDLPINITWLHNNRSVNLVDGVLVSKAGKKVSTITIDSVQYYHSGTYTCLAVNNAGHAEFSAELRVNGMNILYVFLNTNPSNDSCINSFYSWMLYSALYHVGLFIAIILFIFIVSPQILPFDFGEESVNSGELASLTCSVHKGDLPMNITWYHNNKTIGYNDGILITKAGKKISTLSIDSVQEVHSGIYTCVAENQAGQSSFSADLHVNGTNFSQFIILC